jgi:hypothetical protein
MRNRQSPPDVFVARVTNPGLLAALFGLAGLDTANRMAYSAGRRFGPIGRFRPSHYKPVAGLRFWSRPMLGLAVILSVFTIRVVADPEGLTVGFGPWGWPAKRIPVSRIRSARVEELRAFPLPGYGYRGLPGRGRLIVRSGPGLILDLEDGGSFGVTLGAGSDQAAGVINAALARRAG